MTSLEAVVPVSGAQMVGLISSLYTCGNHTLFATTVKVNVCSVTWLTSVCPCVSVCVCMCTVNHSEVAF